MPFRFILFLRFEHVVDISSPTVCLVTFWSSFVSRSVPRHLRPCRPLGSVCPPVRLPPPLYRLPPPAAPSALYTNTEPALPGSWQCEAGALRRLIYCHRFEYGAPGGGGGGGALTVIQCGNWAPALRSGPPVRLWPQRRLRARRYSYPYVDKAPVQWRLVIWGNWGRTSPVILRKRKLLFLLRKRNQIRASLYVSHNTNRQGCGVGVGVGRSR